ncbi:uncharacterized protein LOC111102708 isoform X2 [Crassostrea virginica]
MSSLWIHDTQTYCKAFGSGAVISCFNNLGLSQPGFKHLNFLELLHYWKPRMISLSVIVCSIVQLASSASCPQSIPTVSVVPRCPSNDKEWLSAAWKKNCSAMDKYQNCSKDRSFVYHCVLNKNATELMEVCAPIWFMSGFCARFSMTDRRIINDPALDCTKFVPPCPTRFPSNESFKYQMCYSHIKLPTAPQNEKEEHTTFVMAVIIAVLVILVISLLIFIRINWKKNNNSSKTRCEKKENEDELVELIIESKVDSKEIDKISPDTTRLYVKTKFCCPIKSPYVKRYGGGADKFRNHVWEEYTLFFKECCNDSAFKRKTFRKRISASEMPVGG